MLEKIPTDKNGKPLMEGQYVICEVSNGMGPPKKIYGRILFIGKERCFVLPELKEGIHVPNSKIEIQIDI